MFVGDDIGSVEKKSREHRDKDSDYDKQFQTDAFHSVPLSIRAYWEVEVDCLMKII
jgi:hypothetical protein